MNELMKLSSLAVQRKLYQWSRNNPESCLSRVMELAN